MFSTEAVADYGDVMMCEAIPAVEVEAFLYPPDAASQIRLKEDDRGADLEINSGRLENSR